MSLNHAPNIVKDGLSFYYDMYNPKSYAGRPSENLYYSGDFANNSDVSYYQSNASNPLNEIVVFPNPGGTNYCLRSTAVGGSSFTEYQMTIYGLQPSTTYCMSCWVAWDGNWNGTRSVFHSRWYDANNDESGTTGATDGTLIETKVVDGLIWERRYQTFTTSSSNNGQHDWYLGYPSQNTAGYRYFTNIQLEAGSYPTQFMSYTTINASNSRYSRNKACVLKDISRNNKLLNITMFVQKSYSDYYSNYYLDNQVMYYNDYNTYGLGIQNGYNVIGPYLNDNTYVSDITYYYNYYVGYYLTLNIPNTVADDYTTYTSTYTFFDALTETVIEAKSLTYNSDGSFSFDGSNDYLKVLSVSTIGNQFFNSGSWTISAWVKFTSVNKGTDNAIIGHGSATTNNGLHLGERSNCAYFGFYGNDLAGTISLGAGVWNYLTFTYDNSNKLKAIYVNGVYDTSGGTVGYGGTSSYYFEIGRYPWGTSHKMYGSIPAIQCYNRVLTASEIKQNFNAHRGKYGL